MATLAQLCRYYLDCLAIDEKGVTVELDAGPAPDAVEVASLDFLLAPTASTPVPKAVLELVGRWKAEKNRRQLLLGYPVVVRKQPGKVQIEPVLLWSLEVPPDAVAPTVAPGPAALNLAALRSLPGAGTGNAVDEALLLGDQLGLDQVVWNRGVIRATAEKLKLARPAWTWMEDPDPSKLVTSPPLAGGTALDLRNRAVVLEVDKPRYTFGLERELRDLAGLSPEKVAGTALGTFLEMEPAPRPAARDLPLLEVVPLNAEQRDALEQSLSAPLTVITGPPGTGKSQVVTGLVVNAAHRGITLLFTSKNNQAVDVVEERVNRLTATPALLRLGTNEHSAKLEAYLAGLLSAKASPSSAADYSVAISELRECEGEQAQLAREVDEQVRLRNRVDQLEGATDSWRAILGTTGMAATERLDLERLWETFEVLRAAVDKADRDRRPLLTRLLWPFLGARRYARVEEEGRRCGPFAEFGISPPDRVPDELTFPLWRKFVERAGEVLEAARGMRAYLDALTLLRASRSAQDVALSEQRIGERKSRHSLSAWTAWISLRPERMTPSDRSQLGNYLAALRRSIAARIAGIPAGPDVAATLESFKHVARFLPAWAVTSLSARGRVPFVAGHFDLLVVDEASQCDIASLLPLLYRAKRAVVIGDPNQLRHISSVTAPQEKALCKKHEIGPGDQAWCYSVNSAWDRAASAPAQSTVVDLLDHYRSHADIIGFSNRLFYGERLRVITRHDRLVTPRGTPPMHWVHVCGAATRPDAGGALNEKEAQAVVAELKRLLIHEGYHGDVGVVSPFRAQANRIRELFAADPSLAGLPPDRHPLVDTVHAFQGDERDVVFFSPTISEDGPSGAVTFLKRNRHLFNVAITRARACLVVVGDRDVASKGDVEYLARFADWVAMVGAAAFAAAPPAVPVGTGFPAVARPELVSVWEKALYAELRKVGLSPIPQYPLDGHLVDLALIDGSRKLAIEVDGEHYHKEWDGELSRRDRLINRRRVELGWDVLRIWVYELRDRMPDAVDRVRNWHAGGGV